METGLVGFENRPIFGERTQKERVTVWKGVLGSDENCLVGIPRKVSSSL